MISSRQLRRIWALRVASREHVSWHVDKRDHVSGRRSRKWEPLIGLTALENPVPGDLPLDSRSAADGTSRSSPSLLSPPFSSLFIPFNLFTSTTLTHLP